LLKYQAQALHGHDRGVEQKEARQANHQRGNEGQKIAFHFLGTPLFSNLASAGFFRSNFKRPSKSGKAENLDPYH